MERELTGVGSLLRTTRRNAAVGWILTGVIALTAIGNVLLGNVLWAGFAGVVAVLAVLPSVVRSDPYAMIPWEVFVLAALPLLGYTFGVNVAFRDVATYLSVTALALIVAVELHMFTSVKMNYQFAVLFVVVATVAFAGVWAIVRWLSDIYLGTQLLLVPSLTEHEIEQHLMWEFVASTVAGLLGGVVFEVYIRRYVGVRSGGSDHS
ncbi:MAG: hypothetical protein ACOCR6_01690 [archaeon]